jgi:N-acetylmuramoyl-L-alanine amidase
MCSLATLAGLSAALAGQSGATRAAPPLTIVSSDGRKPLNVTVVGEQEMAWLDELAAAFQLTVRDEPARRAITVGYKGRTIVLTPEQALASVSGRLVSLAVAPIRQGTRWLVPLDVLNRALALVYDAKLEVRRDTRLILVGDLRIPRLVARAEDVGTETRVTFDMTPRATYTIAQDANRLLIRFDVDALDAVIPPVPQQGLVTNIRPLDATTIEIDLGPRFASFRASSTAPTDGGPARLVIDVLPKDTETVAPPSPPPAAPPPDLSPLIGGSPPSAVRTIAIDPGHGGGETGARGPGGTLEKDITLGVARRLRAAIESRLGIRVLLTRDADQDVGLDDRASMANNNKADLFLSLHVNAAPKPEIAGAEVYYLSQPPRRDEAGQQGGDLQGRLAATIGGGTRDIDVMLWDLAQSRFLAQSAALAGFVEQELRTRIDVSARGVEQAPFRVLVGANMPAVLVELGYITNPAQEQKLASAAFQDLIAQGLFESVLRFRTYLEQSRPAARTGR